jgi:hypothetical protein
MAYYYSYTMKISTNRYHRCIIDTLNIIDKFDNRFPGSELECYAINLVPCGVNCPYLLLHEM